MKTNKSLSSKIALVLSLIIFGTLGPFVRNIPLSSAALALCRAAGSLVLIGGYLLISKQKLEFKKIKKGFLWLVLSGAALGFNWILLFESYKHTSVSLATLSYYFAPVLVTVISPLMFKEKTKPIQWLCSAAACLGVALIIGFGGAKSGTDNLLGVLLGLGAAVFYAAVVLINKFIKSVSGISKTFFQFSAAAIVLTPYVLLVQQPKPAPFEPLSFVCLLCVILIHTAFAYCLYFSSVKNISGQQVAVLSYVDPLVAVLLSAIVLNEKLTVLQIIGGALILGFTLLNELSVNKAK